MSVFAGAKAKKKVSNPYQRNNAGRVDQNAQIQRMRQQADQERQRAQSRQRQQDASRQLSSMSARQAPQQQTATRGADPIQQARGRAAARIASSPAPVNRNDARRDALMRKMDTVRSGGNTSHNLLVQAIEKQNAAKAEREMQEALRRQGGATQGLSSMQPGSWGTNDFDPRQLRVQGVNSEQMQNAYTIYKVGKQKGASDRDIQIALMTAFQESGLRNINYGDRDSVGLFQQRTSQGWGSVRQIMDPVYSAGKFYDDLLGRVGDKRNRMSLTQAAQAVQRSAYPDHYAKHEGKSSAILNAFMQASGGQSGQRQQAAPSNDARNLGPTPVRQQLLQSAFSMLGIPYAWGGGGYNNRSSRGTGKGTENVIGVDCSGLTSYVYGTVGIKLPRHSTAQYGMGVKTSVNNAKPGDLIGKPGGGHVGIYIGNGQMLHSPRPGQRVQIRKVLPSEFAVSIRMPGD